MKSLYLRSGLALLCAVILSACGGSGGGDLPLQGSISGLNKSGLVLINKSTGEKLTVLAGDAGFSFTKLAGVDEQFDIQIDTQPVGAKCDIASNTGKANVYTYNRIVVSCSSNPWTLGGTITGLIGKGLVLANGSDTVAILPPAVAGTPVKFTFPNKVADGAPFGATVLLQPEGQTCTVDPKNNPAVMPGYDALELAVDCQIK
jgi:hypothetical protein